MQTMYSHAPGVGAKLPAVSKSRVWIGLGYLISFGTMDIDCWIS